MMKLRSGTAAAFPKAPKKENTETLTALQRDTLPEQTWVWYACYGSNLSADRFMKYIRRCTDRTPPAEYRPYLFPHPIYFAKSAKTWDHGRYPPRQSLRPYLPDHAGPV